MKVGWVIRRMPIIIAIIETMMRRLGRRRFSTHSRIGVHIALGGGFGVGRAKCNECYRVAEIVRKVH